MQFQHNISRRIINTEIHQQNYGQKTGGQNDEKTLELKNNVELNEQVTYEEKIEKNAIPETLMRSKERKSNTDTNRVHSNDTSERKKDIIIDTGSPVTIMPSDRGRTGKFRL